jgi:hypothetical protein
MTTKPVSLFYSYAHADESFRKAIGKHLAPAERAGLIASWHDRMILPGQEWAGVIDEEIKKAELILLLVSSDFLASDYCWNVEMAYALDAHNRGVAVVVPIFIRPTDFSLAPFAKLQGLPRDAHPVASWSTIDEPLASIAIELRNLANEISSRRNMAVAIERASAGANSELIRDANRIKQYYKVFLRPAFSVPCVFEMSLKSFKGARSQIAEALGTGMLRSDTQSKLIIAPRAEFESPLYRTALDQVVGYLVALERSITALESTLGASETMSLIMEFHLPSLPKLRMKTALCLMDRIDSQRNSVVHILNHLFEYAGVPKLPEIKLSSELIQISAILEKLGLEYSWDLYYFRSHRDVLRTIDPAKYNSFWKRKLSEREKRMLQEHVATILTGEMAEMWGSETRSGREREENVAFTRRLQIALSVPSWLGKLTPELRQAIDEELAGKGYPKGEYPKSVPAKDREFREVLDNLFKTPTHPQPRKRANAKSQEGRAASKRKKLPSRE